MAAAKFYLIALFLLTGTARAESMTVSLGQRLLITNTSQFTVRQGFANPDSTYVVIGVKFVDHDDALVDLTLEDIQTVRTPTHRIITLRVANLPRLEQVCGLSLIDREGLARANCP